MLTLLSKSNVLSSLSFLAPFLLKGSVYFDGCIDNCWLGMGCLWFSFRCCFIGVLLASHKFIFQRNHSCRLLLRCVLRLTVHSWSCAVLPQEKTWRSFSLYVSCTSHHFYFYRSTQYLKYIIWYFCFILISVELILITATYGSEIYCSVEFCIIWSIVLFLVFMFCLLWLIISS